MEKLAILRIILIYFCISCPILIQAQSSAPNSNLPVTTMPLPIQGTPVLRPEPDAIAVSPSQGAQSKNDSRYAEYQSYCRTNDFDETQASTKEQSAQQIKLLEPQLKNDLKEPSIALDLIKAYLNTNDLKNANSVYLKFKDSFSEEENVLLSAEIDMKKNKLSSAANKLERFITDNPKATAPLERLAVTKQKMGLLSEAAEIYLDLQKANKKSNYSLELCEIYTLDSHHRDAEKNCIKAIQHHPENPLPSTFLGVSFRERELFKEAQLHFENSLKTKPSEFALTCIGELFYLQKDKQKTVEYLTQATEQNKSSYRAQIGLAIAQFQEKKYDLALTHFVEACKLGQKDTLEMRKAQKTLEEKNSDLSRKYYDEIQKCKSRYLF